MQAIGNLILHERNLGTEYMLDVYIACKATFKNKAPQPPNWLLEVMRF